MSVLSKIQNIKVPYPSEGVIRTAQIDDPVAPQNSAQLAVNMNFDRVGAIQTRPGVTQYADDLVDAINNYGTLRNAIIPAGFSSIFQLGSVNDIATTFRTPSAVKVSSTKITIFWTGPDSDGFCQNFAIDELTGSVAPIGTPLEFAPSDTVGGNKAILVAGGPAQYIVLNVWTDASGHGRAQAFDVAADTILPGTAYTFDATAGSLMTLAKINATHVLCFYRGNSSTGIATVLAIDLSSLVVSEPGSPLTFDGGSISANGCAPLGDGIHFVNFWENTAGGGTGQSQCFSVNTSTWAITAIGSPLGIPSVGTFNAISVGDGAHIVCAFQSNVSGFYVAQAYAVNLSTFAVTAVGTPVNITATATLNDLSVVGFGDGQHFVAFFSTNVGSGFVQMLAMDPATFNMSLVGNQLSGYDFANGGYTSAVDLETNKVMVVWGNVGGIDGKAAMFQSFGTVVNGRWLYAGSGSSVFNTPAPTGTWTSRRSGLAQVSKPRFSQYLNYIWMVNGNEQIGGDAVATSNGGNFGTDLVPANFPKGDFIHAGFEGRVWVANKTLGIVYYTDIVQFAPPATYILTYNPDVNFITTLTPQTGQSITALYRVPRALLVFTEDSIYRIYGATSVDAYPAYNVGTFSQESIIETKTGIFFHHSSGFYQFDYGSQPVEISRRIIDFVKAIPRANYDDIVGVYDGYDAVEWAVGQVVVEGVVFSNCVVRYTISTQVWTIYDYVNNQITAMIYYDDGMNLNHLMGTEAGKTGAMDTGTTDFTEPFYFEFIDRWRSFTDMYYLAKDLSGFSVHSENAAGANLMYQVQKSGPNAWKLIGAIDEKNTSIMPNSDTVDFDVLRFRIVGNTKGTQIVIHGIEIVQLTIKGQDEN